MSGHLSDCLRVPADGDAAPGTVLHQLRHAHHHALAAQQRGRARVQRLRPVLQAARREPAHQHAQGRHPDPEAQAQEAAGRLRRGRLRVVVLRGVLHDHHLHVGVVAAVAVLGRVQRHQALGRQAEHLVPRAG